MEIYDVMNEKCICVSEPMARVTVEAHRRRVPVSRSVSRAPRCTGRDARATRAGRLLRATAARAAPPRRAPRTPAPAPRTSTRPLHASATSRAASGPPPASAAALRTERISIFFARNLVAAGRTRTARGAGPARCVTHLGGFLRAPAARHLQRRGPGPSSCRPQPHSSHSLRR